MWMPRDCETRPESGGSSPVMISSSVVLPSPLRPTIPTRSPTEIPSETSVSSGRTPYALETRSKLTRFAISAPLHVLHHVRAGDGPGGDPYPDQTEVDQPVDDVVGRVAVAHQPEVR